LQFAAHLKEDIIMKVINIEALLILIFGFCAALGNQDKDFGVVHISCDLGCAGPITKIAIATSDGCFLFDLNKKSPPHRTPTQLDSAQAIMAGKTIYVFSDEEALKLNQLFPAINLSPISSNKDETIDEILAQYKLRRERNLRSTARALYIVVKKREGRQ
jgi:hypothetical protein